MSSFTEARLIPTGRRNAAGRMIFRVEGRAGAGLWFYVGRPAAGIGLHVGEGFLTDLASRPEPPAWLWRLARILGLAGLLRRFLDWVDECLALPAVIHDRMREDLQFELEDCDAYFLIAMTARLPTWPGPKWARLALREIAFLGVRTNRSRIQHNAAASAA